MEELKKVGLDKMPDKWYEQAQLVLWPMDTPTDPFQALFFDMHTWHHNVELVGIHAF